MAINFNSLPTEKPSQNDVIPTGNYVGEIKKAEMKQGKDSDKPPYLNMLLEITDEASETRMGTMWLMLFASEAPLCRFQLKRFIDALHLPITGEFELEDLTKMIVGKKLKIDVKPEDVDEGKTPQRTVLDVSADCFYPLYEGENEATAETPQVFIENNTETTAPVRQSRY